MDPIILFENSLMLAVMKPAGMIVNKADTSREAVTLQDWIDLEGKISKTQEVDKNAYMVDGYNKFDEFIARSGIVHRLDKETSGIILIAKNVDTFINLQEQFKKKIVKKTYLTLVHGRVAENEGEIKAPIARLPWNRMRFGVIPDGRDAHTIYKVLFVKKLQSGQEVSYVEVYPQTGRTHQIRVHFQHIRHPIFADELYAGRKVARDDRKLLPRHFLHASKINFLDPETKEEMTIESNLPPDLTILLETLQ